MRLFCYEKLFKAFISEQHIVHVAYRTSGCIYICNLTVHGTWLKLASQFITNFGDAGLLAIVQIDNKQFCQLTYVYGRLYANGRYRLLAI